MRALHFPRLVEVLLDTILRNLTYLSAIGSRIVQSWRKNHGVLSIGLLLASMGVNRALRR